MENLFALSCVLPGYKRLLIDCFVDCLLLYPQSCVKVHSDLAAARWGFPANVPLRPYDRRHRGGCCCCCWGTCSSLVRRRGCSLLPGCGGAGCWTRLGRRRAAAWRQGGLQPPRSGSPKSHLSKEQSVITYKAPNATYCTYTYKVKTTKSNLNWQPTIIL